MSNQDSPPTSTTRTTPTDLDAQLPDGWTSSGTNGSYLLLTNPVSPFVIEVRPAGGQLAVMLRRRYASSQPTLMLNERYDYRQTAVEQALVWAYIVSLVLAEVTDE